MKVTNGDHAYLVLRSSQDEQLRLSTSVVTQTLPYMFQFPLKGNTEFYTYTINLQESLAEQGKLSRLGNDEIFSQIGILFPALAGDTNRDILIDYIHIVDSPVAPKILLPFLVQENIPPVREVAWQVQQKMSLTDPEFDVSYDDLLSQREQTDDKPIKLVQVSPDNPAPVIIQDGKFFLTDTGEFSASGSKDTTLNYGERYTYTIEFTDRKKQKSIRPGSLTVEFTRTPMAPYSLTAEPGDGEVHLMWGRPFLTVDGKKIQSFAGYNIFRSLEPGQASNTLIYRASPNETAFTDTNLSNGLTYYYTVQSIAPTTSDSYIGDFSQEVSARPADTIPPDVPAGVVGVYTGNAVNLFWNLIGAEDFTGFNVYRSEDRLKEFRRINSQPILQASYQDTTAKAHKTYYYYVTSFDSAVPPNESQPSEIAVVETSTVE
jgi:fibronectin type 3 domain-containing protein